MSLFMASIELVEPSKDNIVTKSNVLIEANYKLGVVEQKIILVLASNIHLRMMILRHILSPSGSGHFVEDH
ncbi:hypothetical protein J22TS1_22070 [Siminovitchia terrae]|nr:RepB family plasmid replication initiator protein [Siminovitchia terrae]GIN91156.1 hypothetical protein J22TS1_22070 [Siminovitchia terrae]